MSEDFFTNKNFIKISLGPSVDVKGLSTEAMSPTPSPSLGLPRTITNFSEIGL